MSRSKSALGGAFLGYLYHGSTLLVGLWLTPFYLRTLGPHDYGIWISGLQVLAFLLLADLGVTAVLPRDVAHAHGKERTEGSFELELLLGQTAEAVLRQTVLIGVLTAGIFLFSHKITPGLRGPIGLVLLVFVATYPLRIFPQTLQGLQDFTFLGSSRLWIWAVSTGLTVLLLMLGFRFYALAWGWCTQEIGGNLICITRLRRIRPELLSIETWRNRGSVGWKVLRRGLWVSVSQVATFLTSGMDVIIVARMLGPAMVVTYSCTAKLIWVLQNQPQMLANFALPGISQMRTSTSKEQVRRATTCLTQATILLTGAIFCVVLPLNHAFVNLWVGERFFGGEMLTLLVLLNLVGRLIDGTLGLSLFAFGYEKMWAIRCLLDGGVSFVMASLLVRGPLGLSGVSLGLCCGVWLVAIPIDVYLYCREFSLTFWDVVRSYLPCIWRFAAVGTVAVAVVSYIRIQSWPVLALAGAAIGCAYLLLIIQYLRHIELGDYVRQAWVGLRRKSRPVELELVQTAASGGGAREP